MSWLSNPATPNYIIATIVAIAVGIGYFRWAKSQGATMTINLQNAQIAAQDRKMAEQDAQIRELRATLTEQTERIKLLTDLVQGVPAWEKLHAGIDKLDRNANRLDQLIEALPPEWIKHTVQHQILTRKIADKLGVDNKEVS